MAEFDKLLHDFQIPPGALPPEILTFAFMRYPLLILVLFIGISERACLMKQPIYGATKQNK